MRTTRNLQDEETGLRSMSSHGSKLASAPRHFMAKRLTPHLEIMGFDVAGCATRRPIRNLNSRYNFDLLSRVLFILVPSSSCSATRRSGNSAGIIRLGVAPGTSAYLEKSVAPSWLRR